MVGGALILAGCLANTVFPPDFLEGVSSDADASATVAVTPIDGPSAVDVCQHASPSGATSADHAEGELARGGRVVLPKKVAELLGRDDALVP